VSETAYMEVAVPELRRYAPDLLRVFGVPIGHADEVADTLVWTEAAVGGAASFIREQRARLFWTPRPRLLVVSEEANVCVIDARGGSLLEFGTRIIDYLVARVRVNGRTTVRVEQTYGDVFIPYLTHLAANRGVRLEVAPESPARPTTTTAFTGAPSDVASDSAEIAAWRARYAESVEQGIRMSPEDFTTVTGLFQMLRVPTSERSRAHAG
jgi:hypothetical protein